ncbi:MAG: hypothetical protein ACOXZ9_06240 [Bacteroidales bacterium]|jgi:hypothetical protein
MKTKLIIIAMALFSLFGCKSDAQDKQLVSVEYNRVAMRSSLNMRITTSETNDSIMMYFEDGETNESGSFQISQNTFDSLANIVLKMNRPLNFNLFFVRDLTETFKVTFIKNDRTREYKYKRWKIVNKKTLEREEQAIQLMRECIDNYRKTREQV